MRHYFPMQTQTGWAVAYRNHRGDFVAFMECQSLRGAYEESAALTRDSMRREIESVEVAVAKYFAKHAEKVAA